MAPFLIPAITGALLTVASSLVGRVLVALGVGAIAYTGLSSGLSYFQSTFSSAMGGAGGTIAGMAGTLQLDAVMSIYAAVGLVKFALSGATAGGTMKKMVLK